MEDRFGKDIWKRLTKDGYVDVISKTDMREACRSIDANYRVLTVHGTNDEVIPVGDAYEFAKMIRSHQLKIIQGANHGYTSHQEEMDSAVLAFSSRNA
ncbi:non-heme chloroperoxidase-like [Salvia splendens]|nr:non-heme chloroperoxidase-like [Salvia splendens]